MSTGGAKYVEVAASQFSGLPQLSLCQLFIGLIIRSEGYLIIFLIYCDFYIVCNGSADYLAGQWVEDFGLDQPLQRLVSQNFCRVPSLAIMGTNVAGHDDNRIAEVDGPTLAVC